MGLSLERIMTEMADVPLREDVWSGFLRDNAARVLGIDHR
jgi:predicted TIM-barrel fold metal-dependent hydrolase